MKILCLRKMEDLGTMINFAQISLPNKYVHCSRLFAKADHQC